jgi:hypothetical protein
MTFSLRRPPPGLTLIHQLLWPLIFAQLIALKARVRAQYGRGVPYGYLISPWGRVTLTYIGTQGFTTYSAAGSIAPVLCAAVRAMPARLRLALAADVSAPVPPVRDAGIYSVYVSSLPAFSDSS